jgi:hypothetical protein
MLPDNIGFMKMDDLSTDRVLRLIRGRGLQPAQYSKSAEFLKNIGIEQSPTIENFYRLMKRYSVRLLLHDLLAIHQGAKLPDLLNYCSETSARNILKKLAKIGLVINHGDEFNLQIPKNIRAGDLLEWFVASCLRREFGVSAIFNTSLRGGKAGGDYDVLGEWIGKLLLIEAKSAPPKGIHNAEISGFLQRIISLMPDIAIFINDTHLRVKDKIVLMFEEEMIQMKGIESLKEIPVQRVSEQIFHLKHYIYIMNSKRGIRANLTEVFRDYLQHHSSIRKMGFRF